MHAALTHALPTHSQIGSLSPDCAILAAGCLCVVLRVRAVGTPFSAGAEALPDTVGKQRQTPEGLDCWAGMHWM